jgi:glycosyltransferase involved in cell wall biosynthesis
MILMYHKIHPEVKSMWWVSPDAFYLQMLDLQSKKVVFLDDYDSSDPSHCVITFDGVYENVWKYGVPILKRFDYPFELFIVGDQIGKGNEFDKVEPPAKFADAETLEKMVAAGGRLQWHTRTHPLLLGRQPNETYRRELTVPEHLRELCPPGFRWFAYPHGKRDEALKEQVRKYYRGALACDDGTGEPYDLPRMTVVENTRFTESTVSVIIPCYNYGHFLAEAIESVLLQTCPPDEILVIDDASTDNSVEVARRYEPRVRLEVNPENLGVVENFNKAVRMTSGDYICFLGADNRFRSDYIEKSKSILDCNEDIGMVYTHFALFGTKAAAEAARTNAARHPLADNIFIRTFPAQPNVDIRTQNYIHGSSMYRRTAYEQAGGYQQGQLPEDNSLFARMLDHGWKARLWDAPALEYRQHSKDQINFLKAYEMENVYLRAKIRELMALQNDVDATAWGIFQRLWRLGRRLFPARSRRENILRMVFHAIRSVWHLTRRILRRLHGIASMMLERARPNIQ